MISPERNGIVVLSGPMTPDRNLSHDSLSRLETGINLWEETGDSLILAGGSSELMLGYMDSTSRGPIGALVEDSSRDTVGNALFTRENIIRKYNFSTISLVTAPYHIRRAKYVFENVMPDIDIRPVEAPESEDEYGTSKMAILRAKEVGFMAVSAFMLRGNPDTETLMSRVSAIEGFKRAIKCRLEASQTKG